MRLSKKYTFAMLAICLGILVIPLVMAQNVPTEAIPWVIGCTDLLILVSTVTYLTGQAKIDLTANYGPAVIGAPLHTPGRVIDDSGAVSDARRVFKTPDFTVKP